MTGDVLRALQAARGEGHATGVEIEGLRTLPGAAVRAAAGVAALLVVLVAGFAPVRGPVGILGAVLALLLVALVVLRPRTGWVAWLLLLVGLRMLLLGPPSPGRLAALLLVVHLAVVASLLAARVARGMRVETVVPLRALRRAWPAQLGAQVIGLVVSLVGQARVLPGGELWRVVALVAAVALVAVALPARRRR